MPGRTRSQRQRGDRGGPGGSALLNKLAPDLGDLGVVPFTERGPRSHVPPKANPLDFAVSGVMPLDVPSWNLRPHGAATHPPGEFARLGRAGRGLRKGI